MSLDPQEHEVWEELLWEGVEKKPQDVCLLCLYTYTIRPQEVLVCLQMNSKWTEVNHTKYNNIINKQKL